MKYFKTLFFLSALFLIACNEDDTENNEVPSEQETADYGSYLYNGVEKNLVGGFFRVSESDELLLKLVDEDQRMLRLSLYDFDGPGVFQRPSQTTEFDGSQIYTFEGSLESLWLGNDSSNVSVLNVSDQLISGSFDLRLINSGVLIGANWSDGQFYDVPAYELEAAGVGAQYLSRGSLITIDSIHSRITNTFFGEIYVYGTSFHGRQSRDVFRFEIYVPENTINPPGVRYGTTPYFFSLYDYDVENSFDGNSISSGEIKDNAHGMSIRFENQPIDEYPKDYGADGELVLYRPDETINFDVVDVNLDYGADTVVVATNSAGNTLIAARPPLTFYQYGLQTNSEMPGVDIQLYYYSDGSAPEPDWTSRGYMHYDWVEDQIINLGYETYYLAPDHIIPTYLRIKNHQL
jgi:hypothetical protein